MIDRARRLTVFATLAAALVLTGCSTLQNADLDSILGGGTDGGLDEATVLAGLKEALMVGSGNASTQTSTVDGFLGNELIRITMPDQLQGAASTLRTVGLGTYVDELEVAMNRAAEQAAGEARQIFWSAVASITIADAFAILRGHDTAATEYFRDQTEDQLRARFAPIVAEKTESVGLGQLYGQLSGAYEGLPLTGKPELVDLDAYVTDRALNGLFTVLAEEEQAIRHDPVARTTDLLRRVFGG